jgi:hypothetical protein
MKTNSMKLWLASLSCFTIAACGGPDLNATNAAKYAKIFEEGRASLDRNNPGALPSPWEAEKFKKLWDQRDWVTLSGEVMQNGYDMDVQWFYLGEAAYGENLKAAAVTYYRVALGDSTSFDSNRRCRSFPHFAVDLCSGFVFPNQIQQRLNLLSSEGYH